MAKLKGIKDKSETPEKVVASKSGSWIDDLQAKKDAETAPTDQKPVEIVKRTKKAPKYRQSHHTGHSCLRNSVCVSRDGGLTAVKMSRDAAAKLVKSGLATYAKRALWKSTVRGTSAEVIAPVEVKEKKVKKAKKVVDKK
jgi:hypothetical protein